ncbi:glycoprotein endo-alpha-1,2-mannosidase isoform X2 [Manacus candei]|uniref:glycoprotein endo-alpha-1,2-mannosidase isoform X2 n=1 Tax=Manacus candei TaxID=415023 RepID=UPI002225DCCE|nr:glycoprotein endo-alpha-1,2-mannosidase isoform X2 [Manacus candei]
MRPGWRTRGCRPAPLKWRDPPGPARPVRVIPREPRPASGSAPASRGCGQNPSVGILNYDIMARFRRRTCIILLLFILFICSIMMALKTLRPDRAGFGDPFGLGLLPELQQRTVLLDSVIVLSWYPPGMADENGEPTDDLVPVILDYAHKYNLKVTFHIEPYKDRDDRSMYHNVKYIIDKYGGHPAFYRQKTSTGKFLPMFYVYDSYVTIPEIWANLLTVSGSQSIRNTPYDALFIALLVEERHKHDIHRSGFDGMYTYFATNGFSYGSSHHNWAGLKAFCDSNNLMFIPSVGPGYIDTSIRPWNNHNTRNRVNGKYYETAFSAALLVRPEIISITSFNEWHEGTQIEKAVPKRTGQMVYLDYKPHKPNIYLELTQKWSEKYRKEQEQWLM